MWMGGMVGGAGGGAGGGRTAIISAIRMATINIAHCFHTFVATPFIAVLKMTHEVILESDKFILKICKSLHSWQQKEHGVFIIIIMVIMSSS